MIIRQMLNTTRSHCGSLCASFDDSSFTASLSSFLSSFGLAMVLFLLYLSIDSIYLIHVTFFPFPFLFPSSKMASCLPHVERASRVAHSKNTTGAFLKYDNTTTSTYTNPLGTEFQVSKFPTDPHPLRVVEDSCLQFHFLPPPPEDSWGFRVCRDRRLLLLLLLLLLLGTEFQVSKFRENIQGAPWTVVPYCHIIWWL